MPKLDADVAGSSKDRLPEPSSSGKIASSKKAGEPSVVKPSKLPDPPSKTTRKHGKVVEDVSMEDAEDHVATSGDEGEAAGEEDPDEGEEEMEEEEDDDVASKK